MNATVFVFQIAQYHTCHPYRSFDFWG